LLAECYRGARTTPTKPYLNAIMDADLLPSFDVSSRAGAPQRTRGRLEVAFRRRAERTVVERLFQEGAAKGRLPRDHGRGCPDVALINLAGGLTGGDEMTTVLRWADGTRAGATTQAAEKIYRAQAGTVRVDTTLAVGTDAWAEWLPQETILFERGDLERRLTIDVAAGGRVLACEPLVLGRLAMGERLASARLVDRIEVRLGGELVWLDVTRLDPPLPPVLDAPELGGGARAFATVLYVGADAAARREAMRELAAELPVAAGVTVMGPVLLARLHDPEPLAMRRALVQLLQAMRARLGELPARLPRLWHT
jgi:urease accessory protein